MIEPHRIANNARRGPLALLPRCESVHSVIIVLPLLPCKHHPAELAQTPSPRRRCQATTWTGTGV